LQSPTSPKPTKESLFMCLCPLLGIVVRWVIVKFFFTIDDPPSLGLSLTN
jgi:hypothetical protein